MLSRYDKQLVNARRLARYRRSLQLAGNGDEARLAREAKRRMLVDRVAREVIDNLLVTGVDNPIVNEIVDDLEESVGSKLVFEYPFMEQDLQIFRETKEGPKKLTPEETDRVLSRLWDLTIQKVDETML
jgi:hypothetical protein